MWLGVGTGIWGSETEDIGGGTHVQILYTSGGYEDVQRSEAELPVALHEAGDCLVCGAVLYLQEGQGQTSAASWQGSAATYYQVEMGRDQHGLHHEVTKDGEGCGFHLFHCG